MNKIILIYILIGLAFVPVVAYAEETDSPTDVSYYDYSEINQITQTDGITDLDFEEIVNDFVRGDVDAALEKMGESILDTIFAEMSAQKTMIIKIISIGMIAAIFSNITGAFVTGNISETGFYITFTALMGVMVAGYHIVADMVFKALDRLIELMEAIVPVYVLSVGFASGQSSAVGFYQIVALIIIFVEKILQTVIIPLIYIYMITGLMNNIINGAYLTKACELIKSVVNWSLKAFLSVVVGMNVIQGLINPVVDSLKTSSFGKAASLIPGIGGALNSMSGIILGSGTLIKNSIGMASMVVIVSVSFGPVIKALIMSLAYKGAGALMEPVSDKRIISSISGIYESMGMLAKTLLYAVVFFLLSIAIVCSSTNHNMT